MTSAKVVCDSVSPEGSRLITMEVELHRFVLSEFNTHRCFSRNFQSSRAVPVAKMIKQVRENPAMPVHWGKNQCGMVAEEECGSEVWIEPMVTNCLGDLRYGSVQEAWANAAQNAAHQAEYMVKAGYHKQIVNRLLEPFIWTRGVCTATLEGYQSFFKLRSHADAQPEIKALSEAMEEALAASVPRKLEWGQYHMPYADIYDDGILDRDIEDAIKVSTSCCAQVSYRVLDDSLDKAIKIYGMLNLPEGGKYKEDPPHFSPTEHVAVCNPAGELQNCEDNSQGNFGEEADWWQYRKALENGEENYFINKEGE